MTDPIVLYQNIDDVLKIELSLYEEIARIQVSYASGNYLNIEYWNGRLLHSNMIRNTMSQQRDFVPGTVPEDIAERIIRYLKENEKCEIFIKTVSKKS